MPIRIAFIGAGSIEFTRKLFADLLTVPEFADLEVRLMDIDRENLAKVSGAAYVLSVARIGGLEACKHLRTEVGG